MSDKVSLVYGFELDFVLNIAHGNWLCNKYGCADNVG